MVASSLKPGPCADLVFWLLAQLGFLVVAGATSTQPYPSDPGRLGLASSGHILRTLLTGNSYIYYLQHWLNVNFKDIKLAAIGWLGASVGARNHQGVKDQRQDDNDATWCSYDTIERCHWPWLHAICFLNGTRLSFLFVLLIPFIIFKLFISLSQSLDVAQVQGRVTKRALLFSPLPTTAVRAVISIARKIQPSLPSSSCLQLLV